MIPASPRLRRRLTYLGGVAAVLLAIVGAFLLSPEQKQPNTAATGTEGSATLAPPIHTKVSPATRRAINATLDRFIPAAMDRKSMRTAWHMAGPELKAGSTLHEWLSDSSPIPYYPAGGTFHNWVAIDSRPHSVSFNLMVYPQAHARVSPWLLSGEVILVDHTWEVNRLYTVASEAPDTAPLGFGSHKIPNLPAPKALLASKWLLAVISVVGLAVLFPLGFALMSFIGGTRSRRKQGPRALPPLPIRDPRS